MSSLQWQIVEFTSGRGIEISNIATKAFSHFIKVHSDPSLAEVRINSLEKLDLFADNSLDFILTADNLHELDNIPAAIEDYLRVIKVGGYLLIAIPTKNSSGVDYSVKALRKGNIKVIQEIDTLTLYVTQKCLEGPLKLSYEDPRSAKTACVIRYGAFGDQMQASSVYAGLKKQGYHITLISQRPGSDVILHDPNLDKIVILDRDQVPNVALTNYWDWLSPQYDKFVNLSESVEGTFLAMKDRVQHTWPADLRRFMMSHTNYLEFQHKLAGVPHNPKVKFFSTKEEEEWATEIRKGLGKIVVMIALCGSSVHKVFPQLDQMIARMLITYKDVSIILVGGTEGIILESGWEKEPRVLCTAGKWDIRKTLTMINHCQLLIGPETGTMNAAACLKLPKIVFLSHSSVTNLTRDWVNTTSLSTKTRDLACSPCNTLHFDWEYCHKDPITNTALCQSMIPIDTVWDAITKYLDPKARKLK